MLYRDYGKTGKQVSAIGFGAMRFPNVADEEAMAALVLAAFEKGVNYFDTAPGYCQDKSEIIVGKAVSEMKRRGGRFYVATKSGEEEGDKVRAELERSLRRLNLEAIDFFHCWCVLSMEDWALRKAKGAVSAMLKARDEGLIRHACVSTHLAGEDIGRVLGEGCFEGVTLGYSAVNFPYRQLGIEAARKLGLGVVIMNPLGGGLIPKHQRFGFIRREGDPSTVGSALRFVLSTPGVTSALVGFAKPGQIAEAVSAVEPFKPLAGAEMDAIRKGVEAKFDKLCTLCRYCDVCEQQVPAYQFMSAYNYLVLEGTDKELKGQLKWHWGLEDVLATLEKCTRCGNCEAECTQKLPIVERLEEIVRIYQAEKAKAQPK
jgi:hypothetical protein